MSSPEVNQKRCARYYQTHKKERHLYNSKYYRAHKKEARIRWKKYYQNHKEELIKKSNQYVLNNRIKVRVRSTKLRQKKRQELIELYGGKCIRCGFSDWRALQIDHIDGGGNKQKKNYLDYKKYYTMLKKQKDSGKYQLLCANCNWIKRFENNENR